VNDLPQISCYGYALDSEIELRFARPGQAPESLRVVMRRGDEPVHDESPMLEWPTPNGVAGKLYGGGQIYDFWADEVGWFRIAPLEHTIEVPPAAPLDVYRELHLWGVPTMVTFTRLGDLSLHGAAFEIDGNAVIVAAPGRHGKTTLALALHRAGARLLTEDIARVRFTPDPVVFPGPAVLRMRADSVRDLPNDIHIVEETPARVMLAIDRSRRGDAEPVPLHAVVLLRIAGDDEVRLTRVSSTDALRDMWALAFRIPDSTDRTRAFEQLADIARTTPVYDLYRPLTYETLPEVVEAVMGLCNGS
jgi:hypothetical protein